MIRKVILSILILVAASFTLHSAFGHLESLAFAADSGAQASAATPSDSADVSSEDDVAPPDLSGIWLGSVTDNSLGSATFTFTVEQKRRRLKGTWSDDIGDAGKFLGHVASDGASLVFKFKVTGHRCRLLATGTLISPTEISGTYTTRHCSSATFGTFDVIHQ
jgi:hypothetical protein